MDWAIKDKGLSQRRACDLAGIDPRVYRYRSIRPNDAVIRKRLLELANERRRFGYRRLFVLLRREGERSGINRIYRLYREEGLAVRRRRTWRKASGNPRADPRGGPRQRPLVTRFRA